jgi:contact-dependent growth inhibition (CDI) system CdiI-like immunity protein
MLERRPARRWSLSEAAQQERRMFQIRAITCPLQDDSGQRYAGGVLQVDQKPIHFRIDLSTWSLGDYERQWRAALQRMLCGARVTALMRAWRGPRGDSHVMWVLWQESGQVFVQEQTVVTAELHAPFDPALAHEHIGARMPAGESGLPLREWRTANTAVYAAALGIRWPFR